MKVGFIGLGNMGSGVAANLFKAGHALTIYNRTPTKTEALVAKGATFAKTPGGAARGDVVITMLADDAAVEGVVFGTDGVLAGLRTGSIHISMSTISVSLAERLASAHQTAGQRFVAAPVFGRPEAAVEASFSSWPVASRKPCTSASHCSRPLVRDLVWVNVTANPTAEWIVRQVTEAFPWDDAPQYLIRDRDRIYGTLLTHRLRAMGIRDKPTAPASPWQNGFAERLIGSIRRERVDHFVVLGEAHLRRMLRAYARYYNDIRTHRSLDKDAPASRPVQRTGSISSHAILGGLHHHYVRV